MASIIPFIRKTGVVFGDDVTALLGQAFDAACRELHDKGQPDIVYEIIAARIIEERAYLRVPITNRPAC